MKHLVLKTFILLNLLNSFALNAKEIIIQSKITSATVYLNGATVERQSDINLPRGSHELIFKGISKEILGNSIQVKSSDNITLLAINHLVKIKDNNTSPQKIRLLSDSLEILQVQKLNEQNTKYASEQELAMILANKEIKGKETLSIDDIKEFSVLYRQLIPEIKSKILISDLLIKQLNKNIYRIENELLNYKSITQEEESIIKVKVDISDSRPGKISISYLCSNAFWEPEYDIRVGSINEEVNLTYKANIYQNTGNDWNNIELNLSTGNPSLKGTIEELETWRINYYDKRRRRRRRSRYKYRSGLPKFARGSDKDVLLDSKADSNQSEGFTFSGSFNNSNENEIGSNYHFSIKSKYSIPSQIAGTSVEVKRNNLPAYFSYLSIPKKESDAFLLAKLSNWNRLNLIPGHSNIYFEGNFVGESYIDPYDTEDTLNISLGRDKNIFIKREKTYDLTQSNIVTNSKKRTIDWSIEVKNLRKEEINITIQDQIPISKRKDLVINLIESSSASFDEETGILTWDLKLTPGQYEKLKLSYSIKYPRNKRVNLD